MKLVRLFFLLSTCFLSTGLLTAQEILPYPSMKEVEPAVNATLDTVGNEYQYGYSVYNGTEAEQRIRRFMVQVRSSTTQGVAPNYWWVSKATRPNLAAVTWASLDSTKDIGPDSSISNLKIISLGLPSIVLYYAVGRIPIPYGEFIVEPGTGDVFINSAQGRTIGPADPPTPFNALTFLDTIKSYITQSRTLGWIANDAAANKYRRLIDTARFHLQAHNRGVTKAKLDSVLLNANTDSSGTLTSEAYALIRFNTEYVLRKLEEAER